ncbi:GNAT family N-acetyltransferase [Cloacibacillus sp. An23]|uniref:GNAT family N-acetyltransferase n=1 Tax=Cloacibacillus sp. An23 TaxID=1965591 RepID=UPI00195195B9|nr:GNAT family N-acetyltransferase [Cloacibacillus sp. An23]
MLPGGRDEVIGYYTPSAASVLLDSLPGYRAGKLRYPVIPAALLGRLAVAHRFIGEGLGKVLLYDAIERTRRAEIACYAVIVDAKDEKARDFYIAFGFEPFKISPLKLFFVL